MITNNVISRVLNIRWGNSLGTCFLIEHNSRQYVVTAKHVVDNLQSGDTVQIFSQGGWQQIPVQVTGHSQDKDVSVFAINQYIPCHPLPTSTAGLTLSQDMFFLGFPLGFQGGNETLNRGLPFPIVKKAILSAMFITRQEGEFIFLDGHNNKGFSGGPVVYRSAGDNGYKVCGVIHGYAEEEGEVFDADGDVIGTYIGNSGIIKAYCISCAIDLIVANPNGVQVPPVTT